MLIDWAVQRRMLMTPIPDQPRIGNSTAASTTNAYLNLLSRGSNIKLHNWKLCSDRDVHGILFNDIDKNSES